MSNIDNTNRPGPWRHARPAWIDEPEDVIQWQRYRRAGELAQRVADAAPTPKPAPEPAKRNLATLPTNDKAAKPAQPLKKRDQAAAQPRRGQSATPAPDKPSDRRTAPQAPKGDGLATSDDLALLLARRPDRF